MRTPAARFTGRVLLQSGSPAYGCRVALTIPETTHLIAQTWTSSKGAFILGVPAGRLGGQEAGGFTLDVTDGTGTVLAHQKDVVARAGRTTHLELTASSRAMVTLPEALPLLRAHHTPILRPEAMAVVDAALGLLAPSGSHAHEQYGRAARLTLPPPGHVEELLELSWAALDGDPGAMRDLREVLGVQAATVRRDVPAPEPPRDERSRRPSRHHAYGVPKDDRVRHVDVTPATVTGRLLSSTPPEEGHEDAERLESAVVPDRLMPLLVATVRISHGGGERVAFFDGLHGILSGLSTIDRLHRAALDVLQERRIATLRALLALLMADTAEDTNLPLPTAGGVRSPGADPALPDLVDPWWEQLQHCVAETVTTLRATRDEQPPYRIDDVTPPDAAPGEVVTITGEGFGASGGDVVFTGAAPTEPLGWSDTEIQVVVPELAHPGPVSLRILEGVVRVRRKLVEYYLEGRGFAFEGGRPAVRSVLVDGRAEGTWVRPGEAIAVSWTTIAGPHGRVALSVRLADPRRRDDRETVLLEDDDLPGSGSRILQVPQVDREHELRIRVRVANAVTSTRREASFPVAVPPTLTIEGIEITQAIQHDPRVASRPPVPTVAGRDTFVRVYVSSDREGFQDDCTPIRSALLRVGGLVLRPWPTPGREQDTPFVAGRASAIDRSRIDGGLLFRIPAPICDGTRELHVEVSAEGRPPDAPRTEARTTWTWTAARPLPVRFVRVRADRPDGPTPVPTDEDARRTVARALDLFPTTPDDVGPAWLDTLEGPPMDDGGAEDPAWSVLVDELADLHDGTAWEWAGDLVTDCPPADPTLVHVGVVQANVADRASAERRTVLVAALPEDVTPADPRRTAGTRALATVTQPDLPRGHRVDDIPFDPHAHDTVVDPRHGVHDLGLPPGAGWVDAARWTDFLGRL